MSISGTTSGHVAGRRLYDFWAGWMLERTRMPGVVLSAALLVAAPPLHLGIGVVLGINWAISKVPSLVSVAAAIRVREFRRWSRPQAYQDSTVPVEKAPEIDREREWKVPGWQRKLTSLAERHWLAAQIDDWFSERSRVVAYALDVGSVALGQFIALPAVAIFVINWGVGRIPEINSLAAAVVNRSFRRYARPGAFQRQQVLEARARSGIAHQPSAALVDSSSQRTAPARDAMVSRGAARRRVAPPLAAPRQRSDAPSGLGL